MDKSEAIAGVFKRAQKIVVLTGAGISVESGIPTFRDARAGLWERFDVEALATPAAFSTEKELVWGWYRWRTMMVSRAMPNEGHRALARLARGKSELKIITQNVDDLHERAGSVDVTHLHGSLFMPKCFACARPYAGFDGQSDTLYTPELRITPPRCVHCGGYVRPGVVWFGETLDASVWRRAQQFVKECDLLIVVGTSGIVHPAATLPMLAKRHEVEIVEINPEESEISFLADYVLRSTASDGLCQIERVAKEV